MNINIKNFIILALLLAVSVAIGFFVSYSYFKTDCNHEVECVDSLNTSDSVLVDSLVLDSILVDSIK